MKDDRFDGLRPLRGIINGILVALAIWALLVLGLLAVAHKL